MNNMLDLDKLMSKASIFESITEGTMDDNAYNAVTQNMHEGVTANTREEVSNILSKGNDVNDRLDFDDLARGINSALGINESTEEINKPVEKETEMKSINEASAANPSAGVDTAEKFLNATAVKQTEFVTAKTGSKVSKELDAANTNAEHKVTEHKTDDAVEKEADKSMKEMQKGADGNKEFVEVAKKQETAEAKAVLKESAEKYSAFVESFTGKVDKKYIDGILEGFNVVFKSMI